MRADDIVSLWLAHESLLDDPANADRFLASMSNEELARDRSFLAEPPRRLHRLARGLQREVLSSRVPGSAPRDLEFVTGATGRPALAAPFDSSGLDFNLAHTHGLVVLAVARRGKVGVDVEDFDKKVSLPVARRFFSPVEVDALHALPADEQPHRFLRLWTLKEAYLKATGAGIAGGLGSMTFCVDGAGAWSFECASDPQAAHWSFRQFDVGTQHVVAVARLAASESAGFEIECHTFGGAPASGQEQSAKP